MWIFFCMLFTMRQPNLVLSYDETDLPVYACQFPFSISSLWLSVCVIYLSYYFILLIMSSKRTNEMFRVSIHWHDFSVDSGWHDFFSCSFLFILSLDLFIFMCKCLMIRNKLHGNNDIYSNLIEINECLSDQQNVGAKSIFRSSFSACNLKSFA